MKTWLRGILSLSLWFCASCGPASSPPESLVEQNASCVQNPSGSVNWKLSVNCDSKRTLPAATMPTQANINLDCGPEAIGELGFSQPNCPIATGPTCSTSCAGSSDSCTQYCLSLGNISWCSDSICQASLCPLLCGCEDVMQYLVAGSYQSYVCPFHPIVSDFLQPSSCMQTCGIFAENLSQLYGFVPPNNAQFQPICCDANPIDTAGVSDICTGMCNQYQSPKRLVSPNLFQFTGAIQNFADSTLSCIMPSDAPTQWGDPKTQAIIASKLCGPITSQALCIANPLCSWANGVCSQATSVQWWSCPANTDDEGNPLDCVDPNSIIPANAVTATCYACFPQNQTSNYCSSTSDPKRCQTVSTLYPPQELYLGTLSADASGFCEWSTGAPPSSSQEDCSSIRFPVGGGSSCGDNLVASTCLKPVDSQNNQLCQWTGSQCIPTNTWQTRCNNTAGCTWDNDVRACLSVAEERALQGNLGNGYVPMGNGWWCPYDLGATPAQPQPFQCAPTACIVEAPKALLCGRCIPGAGGSDGLCGP